MQGLYKYWPKNQDAKKIVRYQRRLARMCRTSIVLLPANDHEASIESHTVMGEILHGTLDGKEETIALFGIPREDTALLHQLMEMAGVEACVFSAEKWRLLV